MVEGHTVDAAEGGRVHLVPGSGSRDDSVLVLAHSF